jgi:hypothetical protein
MLVNKAFKRNLCETPLKAATVFKRGLAFYTALKSSRDVQEICMRLYSPQDVGKRTLRGARIAVPGHGSRDRAHALNQRDGGHRAALESAGS